MNCMNCEGDIPKGRKFCGSSCAATFNNKRHPKRKPQHSCKECSAPVNAKRRYCSDTCKDLHVRRRKAERNAEAIPNKVHVSSRRQKLKALAVEYKGGQCELCGYSRCLRALEFHHRDPNEKDFAIGSKGVTRSWEKTKAEVDKCALLCANCHREIHDGLVSL